MAVESLTNARENLPNVYTNITAREIDFVTRFGKNWDALRKIFGIMRPIRKAPGTKLISYSASVTLADGDVDPGNVIPYSKATVVQSAYDDLSLEKYAKAVPIEDVNQYGAQIAIEKTDEAFLNELQSNVLTRFFTFLKTGTLTETVTSFQMGLAMARGLVIDKFNKMRRTVTDVVGFCNVLDAYKYLGGANITVQTAFGMTYIENFMGYSTLFLMSDPDIPQNLIVALPVENIDLYYVDPGDSEFARLGLNYTVQGETNLIGFHANGNYSTAVGESFALMGMKLWAEYLDGIAKVTVNNPNMTGLTLTPKTSGDYWGTSPSDIQTNVAVADGGLTGTLKYYDDDTKALVRDWGEGYFLAVGFSGFSSGLTYANVKVGLYPTAGAGLVTLDPDQDAVLHITDPSQKIIAVQTDSSGNSYTQYWKLDSLTYAPKEG